MQKTLTALAVAAAKQTQTKQQASYIGKYEDNMVYKF